MIRDLTTDDLIAVIDLGSRMVTESAVGKYGVNIDRSAFILHEIIGTPTVFAQGAFKDGELVAIFIGEVSDHMFVDMKLASDLFIYSAPSARGGVHAKQLTNNFVEWAYEREADMVKLEISAGINNDRACQLFGHLGFEDVGTLMARMN